MKLNLPVLQKDDSWEKHRDKSEEESVELYRAIQEVIHGECDENKLLHIAEEALDNIEVSIGILDKLEQIDKEIIKKANLNHIKKLENRGWNFKRILEIRED